MPYKHPPQIRALLDQLEAAKKVAREEHLKARHERSPLVKQRGRLQQALDRANQARKRMRSWHEWSDLQAERIYGQRWRDNTARIAELTSQLLDAEIGLALFDKDST